MSQDTQLQKSAWAVVRKPLTDDQVDQAAAVLYDTFYQDREVPPLNSLGEEQQAMWKFAAEEMFAHFIGQPRRRVATVAGLAESLYSTYCEAVGGKAFNGDDLPEWKEFSDDPEKVVQSDAWIAAAHVALIQTTGKTAISEVDQVGAEVDAYIDRSGRTGGAAEDMKCAFLSGVIFAAGGVTEEVIEAIVGMADETGLTIDDEIEFESDTEPEVMEIEQLDAKEDEKFPDAEPVDESEVQNAMPEAGASLPIPPEPRIRYGRVGRR